MTWESFDGAEKSRVHCEMLVWQLGCDAVEYGQIAAKQPDLAIKYIEDIDQAINALQSARKMLMGRVAA